MDETLTEIGTLHECNIPRERRFKKKTAKNIRNLNYRTYVYQLPSIKLLLRTFFVAILLLAILVFLQKPNPIKRHVKFESTIRLPSTSRDLNLQSKLRLVARRRRSNRIQHDLRSTATFVKQAINVVHPSDILNITTTLYCRYN